MTIDELSTGYLFCDYEYLNGLRMQYSVLCIMPSLIFYVDRDDMHNIDEGFIEGLRK